MPPTLTLYIDIIL